MENGNLPQGTAVTQFHIMAKPIGPVCNLNCSYCYYLSKKNFFQDSNNWRISDAVLEKFICQYITAQDAQQIEFCWQGGEPTLLGLDFFRKALALQKTYCPTMKRISNNLQTNGMLLDEEWCKFLCNNKFLVGLSIDGPKDLHNRYRLDRNNKPTFDKVAAAAELLKKHKVEFNALTVVNRTNAQKPLEVYKFLRDELGSKYLQFIPCVEPKEFANVAPQYWDKDKLPRLGSQAARPGFADSIVTDWSVDPEDYGKFLCTIFDEWLKNDVGKVFVNLFDTALGLWVGAGSSLCCFAEMCGRAIVIEHDGSVYSCDHYVYPEYRLGNIKTEPLSDMVYSERQSKFGLAKSDALPKYCRDCRFRFACNGECPRNRCILTPDGEAGLNYLCPGLRKFFSHIEPWMRRMVKELRAGRTADNVMKLAKSSAVHLPSPIRKHAKLNAPCPCGSGRKYKKCCYPKDRQQPE